MKCYLTFIRRLIYLLFILVCFEGKAIKTLQQSDILELSNNAILCMHQDRNGDMWFGTYDGLNLFNGKNTFVYRFDPDNSNSISGNIIQKITDADAGHLWISTFIGIDRFSIKERKVVGSFLQYPESRLLVVDSLGNTLLVSLADFISYYSPETGEFQDVFLPGIHADNVKALFVDKLNRFYLLSENGLLRQLTINNKDMPVTIKFENDYALHDRDIIHAFYDEGNLYYVDIMNRLYSYDCFSKEKVFLADLSKVKKINGEVSQIIKWQSELYIAFKNNGLIRLEQARGAAFFSVYSDVGVFCLQKDNRQDILWLGTDGQGVQMYYNKEEMFRSIMLRQLPYHALKPVRAIYTDESGDLWLGTKGNGIFRIANYESYLKTSHTGDVINYQTGQDLSDNQVFCFYRSQYRKDILWIGTEGPGLSYYSYSKNKINTLPQKLFQNIRRVHSICEVNDSVLWLATAGDGLLEVTIKEYAGDLVVENIDVYTFKRGERISNEFHSMIFDGEATLYIGSRGGCGVIELNINSKQYKFLPLSNAESSATGDILSVYLSTDSFFYFGASSGLTKMPFNGGGKGSIAHFDRKNGIANDMIHGILEDKSGCLWLSTNKGLTKYNPQNDFFHNFYYSDLNVTEYSDDAYWKCPYTGRLFFGGIDGVVWVEPVKDMREKYIPELRFWELQIQGDPYSLSDIMNKVIIPAKTSSFTISFVATDFIHGENYEYSYFLDGYSDSWVKLQKSNMITFMNLPFGKYLLRVKYKNDVYDSDAKEYTIPIIVLTPWYWNTWAIVLYVVVILLIIYFVYRVIRNKIQRQQNEVAQRIKDEQKQKVYESKLNFFTNITHELFTPLTLINGVADHLRNDIQEKQSKEYKKQLDVLQNNVNSLNELIQEIVDFRKIEEKGSTDISVEKLNISKLIQAQVASFFSIAESDQLQLQLDVPDGIYWNTNSSSIKKIVSNLVSNAFKYAKKQGVIRVALSVKDECLLLKVYNTGVGIDPSKFQTVFDRYRILENMEENKYMQMTARNGLGLFICYSLVQSLQGTIDIVSEVGQFAEIIVRLPQLEQKDLSVQQFNEEKVFVEKNAAEDVEIQTGNPEKPMVLVVDDNKDMVWFVSDTLARDYNVITAYNVSEALVAISQNQPSLIITDVIMPNVDGFEFIRQIKQDKFTKHIPIIIISAKIMEQEQAAGLNIGADAYLTKPFSSVVLQSTVNRLLSNRQELKKYYYSPESAYKYSDGQLLHIEDKAFMEKVVQIIKDNISKENLRPELIAEQLGLNTRNLYRKVKKISSLSPSDFIKDYRFMCAAQLLISTNLNIQEIIYKVGVTNKSYFYREFLKKYQVTPKEYRLNR